MIYNGKHGLVLEFIYFSPFRIIANSEKDIMGTNDLSKSAAISRSSESEKVRTAVEVAVRLGLLFLLVVLCLRIVAPFIMIVAWAMIIAIAARQPFERLSTLLGNRSGLAAQSSFCWVCCSRLYRQCCSQRASFRAHSTLRSTLPTMVFRFRLLPKKWLPGQLWGIGSMTFDYFSLQLPFFYIFSLLPRHSSLVPFHLPIASFSRAHAF